EIKDKQGNALDGENTPNDSPNGLQQALPSGDGTPGGNFFLQFTIDTHAPSLAPGSLHLDPSTDTNIVGDSITSNSLPTFDGTITDIFPPANPVLGDTVLLQVYDFATGTFKQVGQGTTDALGNFAVAPSAALPDSPYNVGPDGLLGDSDDSNYGLARVVIV